MTELIGQPIGNYALEALLATGPTGRLYTGRHLRLGRPAALKLFDADLLARPGVRPRLLAALRDVAALRHPNLATLYDVGDDAGRLYLASELLAGGALRALMQPGQPTSITPATSIELIAQAADGLAAAHAAGLVHGAVKPESLWLERPIGEGPPVLKLADLGVAAALPDEALGAPAYLSPEQCRGQALDGRADLYSLGVVLYELLVGVPPFNVQTVEAAIEQHLHATPVPPRVARPELPPEVEAIVLRCLAKDPAGRFADAPALASALRHARATLAPSGAAVQAQGLAGATAVVGATVVTPINAQPTMRVAAPITPNPAPRVQVVGPQGAVLRTADLGAGLLSVGRAPERDLYLEDPQISREHLRIGWDGQALTVTDLGSANGSFIGGARLAPGVATPWDGRAPLRLGPFTLRVAPAAGQPPLDDPLLTGLLSGAPAAAAQPRPGRVELRIDQERLVLTPGVPGTLPVRLSNSGAATAEVTLTVEGVPGAWLRADDQRAIRLEPQGQAVVSLTVTPPRGPEAQAGDYNVVVRARTPAGGEVGAARLRWTVLPFSAFDLRIAPARAETSGATEYQLLLRNLGNEQASYLLSFEDADELLGYALEQDEVTLDAGQSARVNLRVEAAGRLFGGVEERPFTVQAEDGRGETAIAEGILAHRATLPAWVPLAAIGALVLALALGGWALLGSRGSGTGSLPTVTPLPPTLTPFPTPLPGAPTVELFTAEPQVVAPGELVTVRWSVQGAERVFIDQFGDVPAQGERQFRPEQTTDFTLRGVAPGGRETVVIARVNVAPATATPTLIPTATPAPTLTSVPPSPTVVPPTAAPPTVVPPTVVPPTLAPPPGDATVDLAALAPDAEWRTDTGPVRFGQPIFGGDRGGWAAIANATLEDGQAYQGLLQMAPPVDTERPAAEAEPYIEGEYTLQALQNGQILVGSLGFAQGATSQGVTVMITFAGQELYRASKAPDGQLLPVFIDLSPFGGRAGQLVLRVSGAEAPGGIYWVRPRIDVPR